MTEKDLGIAIEKCERIMEFDTRTLKNPESENGWLFNKVYDLLQFLRQFEFDTDTNGATTDTVSRAAVVDAIEGIDWYHQNKNGEMVHGANDEEHQAWYKADDIYKAIESVPPAQPGWIPWDSGRFPEESGTYTVTAYDGATKRVTYAKYQKRLKRWELTGARAYWRVLAWQPLPTPYREGGQNDGKN